MFNDGKPKKMQTSSELEIMTYMAFLYLFMGAVLHYITVSFCLIDIFVWQSRPPDIIYIDVTPMIQKPNFRHVRIWEFGVHYCRGISSGDGVVEAERMTSWLILFFCSFHLATLRQSLNFGQLNHWAAATPRKEAFEWLCIISWYLNVPDNR